jgi:hypothetical protein
VSQGSINFVALGIQFVGAHETHTIVRAVDGKINRIGGSGTDVLVAAGDGLYAQLEADDSMGHHRARFTARVRDARRVIERSALEYAQLWECAATWPSQRAPPAGLR